MQLKITGAWSSMSYVYGFLIGTKMNVFISIRCQTKRLNECKIRLLTYGNNKRKYIYIIILLYYEHAAERENGFKNTKNRIPFENTLLPMCAFLRSLLALMLPRINIMNWNSSGRSGRILFDYHYFYRN